MTNLETGAVVVALALIPLGFMVWLVATAPVGFEDETRGFVEGDEHGRDDNLGI